MQCIKCKKKNVTQANYCIKCGYEFTKKEKDKAKKKDFWPRVYRIKEKIDFLTLGTLKDKWYIRLLLLILAVGGGIYLYLENGSEMKILKGEDYKIERKKNTNEYQLYSKKEIVGLNIYFPTTPKKVKVKCFDNNKKQLSSTDYKDGDNIVVSLKEKPYVCEIKMNKKNKVILYPKKEVE